MIVSTPDLCTLTYFETLRDRRRWGSSTNKICMETALFQSMFFYDSTSQDKKLLLMLPF